MKKKLKKFLQPFSNEDGSISLYVLIFMIFFLPFAIWIGVQLPMKIEATYSVKQMVSNTADSIISRVDTSELSAGRVVIDEVEAKVVAERMVRATFNLDENDEPTYKGILREKIPIHFQEGIGLLPRDESGAYILPDDPGVFVYIVNNPTGNIMEIKGLLPIENTSVIIRANIPVENGGLLGGRTVIHKTGFSEARLKPKKPGTSEL